MYMCAMISAQPHKQQGNADWLKKDVSHFGKKSDGTYHISKINTLLCMLFKGDL